MNIKITGLFKAAAKAKTLTNGKTTQKFYLDLDKETDYPTMCEIENYDNKIDISKLKEGDKITVHVNLTGRKWTNPEGKNYFFQSLSAWKLETEDAKPNTLHENLDPTNEEPDDLPF